MSHHLRGAQERVLKVISERGNASASLLDLSIETGYSIESVRTAVRKLEHFHFIRVTHGGPRRPNSYEVLPEEQQRAYQVAQVLGLIE